ncbi:MAG: transporter [Elusimicrobia bacterium]|nr:transporter [Elusimicrobiota bacterium]
MRSLLVLLLAPPQALAYRPLQTEDAYVAEHRRFELETSWEHFRGPDGARDHALVFVTNYGVLRRLELSLETPVVFRRPAAGPTGSGFGDVTAAVKALALEERDARPSVLFRGFAKLSNGDAPSGLGAGYTGYGLAAVASKKLGSRALHAAAGYGLFRPTADDRVAGGHFWGLAFEQELVRRWWAVTEITGARNVAQDGHPDPVSGFLGLIWGLSEKVHLDTGLRRGVSRSAPDWQVPVGATFMF